jgi:hypothetical protein
MNWQKMTLLKVFCSIGLRWYVVDEIINYFCSNPGDYCKLIIKIPFKKGGLVGITGLSLRTNSWKN